MNLLEDRVTIAGREVPTVAIGAGVAVIGAAVVLLSRRGRPSSVAPASTPESTPSQTTEVVTPDRLSVELSSLSDTLTGQFTTLLNQEQANQAGQLAGLQTTLTGQVSGLQSQLSGSISDVQSQVVAEDAKVTALTQRVAQVESKQTNLDKLGHNLAVYITKWLPQFMTFVNVPSNTAAAIQADAHNQINPYLGGNLNYE